MIATEHAAELSPTIEMHRDNLHTSANCRYDQLGLGAVLLGPRRCPRESGKTVIVTSRNLEQVRNGVNHPMVIRDTNVIGIRGRTHSTVREMVQLVINGGPAPADAQVAP